MDEPKDKLSFIEMTADIISAYVGNHKLTANELPGLIQTVYQGVANAGQPEVPVEEPVVKPTAAQIRKSITPDALISFLDGKPYKTLKRHLTTHGVSVDEYKAKYGLPRDYPTTAPGYSERRSEMAKIMGLGSKGRGGSPQKAPAKAAGKRARKPAAAAPE